jgi:hypothetical protein
MITLSPLNTTTTYLICKRHLGLFAFGDRSIQVFWYVQRGMYMVFLYVFVEVVAG